MAKAIRTQSKDPVIREAAREGIRLYRWSGGYFTASAKVCARQARVSESYIRKCGWIFNAGHGLWARVLSGALTEDQALTQAKAILTGSAGNHTTYGNQQVSDALADAVAEIRRLRSMLQDAGIDPDP